MSNYYKDSTNTNVIPIIRVGEVTSVVDTTKSGRIRVRITGVDDTESDKSLIECVPLLPKYLIALPKVGECVFVFQYEHNDSSPTASFKNKRFWIGPLITQPTKLEGENYNSALSILPDGYTKLKDPNLDIGAYGNEEDVILQGRFNTDIIQKDNQMWLRAGKTIEGQPNKFNDKNLGYIQLKYGGEKLKREVIEKEVVTYITPSPDTLITVTMNTITNSNIVLSGDLPQSRYSDNDINRTELFITITDANTGSLKTSFENENSFLGSTSREQALSAAKVFIDVNKGDKWKIKTKAFDLIKIYKGNDGIAMFDAIPVEVKKKIKELKVVKNKSEKSSVVNIVASKINLISHDGEHTFELANPKELITDDEQQKINNEAHPLVYGDVLLDFLELVKKYVQLHVHPYHGLSADPSTTTTDVLSFDLNKILNKNINSN
jgi:hypothetical protein